MASQEQLQKYKDLLRAKAHQFFLLGMGLLLLLRLFFFLMEAGYTGDLPATPSPYQPTDSFKPESDGYKNYEKVHGMLLPMVDFRNSDYWILANFNMFDPKKIIEAQRYEEHASQVFEQARVAYKDGNYSQALKLADEALSYQPNHSLAQKMKIDCVRMLGLSGDKPSTSTQSTTPVRPGPPANP